MNQTDDTQILTILQKGQVSVQGEFLWGSNYTFSVLVEHDGVTLQGVYKPTRGERPLWDFPRASLAKREVAAYLVSEALGWRLVPPTVYRTRGPAGAGSVQLYIDHDSEYHYFNFEQDDKSRLRPVVLFDVLVNNADRKGSHILIDPEGHLWLIDHGICFHRDEKLRTVIWDFAGETLPDELCGAMVNFRQQLVPNYELYRKLSDYLSAEEIATMAHRTDRLIASGQFPNPHPNRRPYPWPPV